MRDSIIISNDSGMKIEILPDYGGMVSGIWIKGKPILFLDEKKVEVAPVIAGGIPILFPFAGKTERDTYEVGGRQYYLPMHGLLKNRTFAIKEVLENKIVLWIENDAAALVRNYPYEYHLEIIYELEGTILYVTAKLENRSENILPHGLGWHPYFRVSDREQTEFQHFMKNQYDYIEHRQKPLTEDIHLRREYDHVFCNPERLEYTFVSKADGYQIKIETDVNYQSFVVYTGTEGSVCIEPWCGLPDSVNRRIMVQYLEPGQMKEYKWSMQIMLLDKEEER